ncbi:MAG: hypothetical protein M1831_005510 [Alyxoria varia]|nr:MAG: hypothetical protein M1831_005510 [Alyxoria varia]
MSQQSGAPNPAGFLHSFPGHDAKSADQTNAAPTTTAGAARAYSVRGSPTGTLPPLASIAGISPEARRQSATNTAQTSSARQYPGPSYSGRSVSGGSADAGGRGYGPQFGTSIEAQTRQDDLSSVSMAARPGGHQAPSQRQISVSSAVATLRPTSETLVGPALPSRTEPLPHSGRRAFSTGAYSTEHSKSTSISSERFLNPASTVGSPKPLTSVPPSGAPLAASSYGPAKGATPSHWRSYARPESPRTGKPESTPLGHPAPPGTAKFSQGAQPHVPGLSDPQHSEFGASSDTGTRYMTVDAGQGMISIPVDMQAASKVAAEKRARNAGASARFRARRKEREQASSREIDLLKDRIHDLEEDTEFYRGERDKLAEALYASVSDKGRYFPRPVSPQSQRAMNPTQRPTRTTRDPRSTSSEAAEEQAYQDAEGRRTRRRLNEEPPSRRFSEASIPQAQLQIQSQPREPSYTQPRTETPRPSYPAPILNPGPPAYGSPRYQSGDPIPQQLPPPHQPQQRQQQSFMQPLPQPQYRPPTSVPTHGPSSQSSYYPPSAGYALPPQEPPRRHSRE